MNFFFPNKKPDDFIQFDISATSTMVLVWKIRRIRFFPKSVEYKLDSPPFVYQDATWCLRLYPNAYCNEDAKTYIGFTMVRALSRVPRQRLNVVLKAEMIGENSLVADFDDNHKEIGDLKFLPPAWEVLKTLSSLTLMCHISPGALSVVDGSSQTETLLTQETNDRRAICEDYKNLLLMGPGHDVVLRVKDTDFNAHRNILGVRSPVLRSMMSHEMIEKRIGVVKITDCDPDAFEQFLLYLYCGKVEVYWTEYYTFKQLYYLADKYDVGDLKREAVELIKKALSPKYIVDAVETAKKHSDTDLFQNVVDYFVKDVNRILPTTEWKAFLKRQPTLANELLIKYVETLSGGAKPKFSSKKRPEVTFRLPDLNVARLGL